ncbi:Glutamate 5-kinase [Rhodanobacter lindaniclasticus]
MTAPADLSAQTLPVWRRAVLKVGSNLLAADGGGLTAQYAENLAAFVAASHAEGREVVLVSSGAWRPGAHCCAGTRATATASPRGRRWRRWARRR